MQVSYYLFALRQICLISLKESWSPQRKRECVSSEGRAQRAAQGDKMTVERPNDRWAGTTKKLSPWPGIQCACKNVIAVLR